jgi:hypothetical protein
MITRHDMERGNGWLSWGRGRRVMQVGVLVFVVHLLASSGCVSPLDPDTPRRRIVDLPDSPVPPPRIEALITDIAVFEAGQRWVHDEELAEAEVDTAQGRRTIWNKLVLARKEAHPQNVEFVQGIMLRLDSIVTPQQQLAISGNPLRGTGFALILAAPVSGNTWRYDTLHSVVAGGMQMLMSFDADTPGRGVFCSGRVTFLPRRVTLELLYRIRY